MTNAVKTRRVVVKQPEDIAPAQVVPETPEGAKTLEVQGNTYIEAGNCAECGKTVYKFVSGNPQVNTIGADIAVFVGFSHREKAGVYCTQHDPNIGHRLAAQPSSEFKSGELWMARRA